MWNLKVYTEPTKDVAASIAESYQTLFSAGQLGFTDLDILKKSKEQCLSQSHFFERKKGLIIIGLGGSSLGTKAIYDSLPKKDQREIHFLDNVDALSVDNWLSGTEDLEDFGWIVCSKSGGTLEVLALYDYCYQKILSTKKCSIIKNTLIISETKESSLTRFAKENNVPQLEVPENIGGRFSIFTPVGLFPLLYSGVDLEQIQLGIEKALANINFTQALAAQVLLNHNAEAHAFYSFQYCDRLRTFGFWLQQLWSESLGKSVTIDGKPAARIATFVNCRGASDQHSVLQQIMEGPEKKMVCFHRISESEQSQLKLQSSLFEGSLMVGKGLGDLFRIEGDATEKAIREAQGGTMVLRTDVLNVESISALMMHWMLLTGVLGQVFRINAFDQPGVESGKDITRRVLSRSD